jgi:hypothetical protein
MVSVIFSLYWVVRLQTNTANFDNHNQENDDWPPKFIIVALIYLSLLKYCPIAT